MCYSAQAWQDYEKYVREFDATLSIKDYIRLFWDQATKGSPYRIPKAMMDAFASVISNNLNMVMKFLASVTIVMAIPTMIASFFGMNVPVPWASQPFGFYIVGIVAVALTVLTIFLLWKKRFF